MPFNKIKKILVAAIIILGTSQVALAATPPLTAPQGGTGNQSYSTGDLLYAASTNPLYLTRLTVGGSGNCLTSNGSTPVWGSCGSGTGWASSTDPTSIHFTGSGGVGIGTNSPTSLLNILGTTTITYPFANNSGTAADTIFDISNTDGSTGVSVQTTSFGGPARTMTRTDSSGEYVLSTSGGGIYLGYGDLGGSGTIHLASATSVDTSLAYPNSTVFMDSNSNLSYPSGSSLISASQNTLSLPQNGQLLDSSGSAGNNGDILQTTGTTALWTPISSGGSAFPFTPVANANATSTTIQFYNGLGTQASSTLGALYLSANKGNAGFGTSSPARTLSVQGSGLFSGNVSVATLTATGTVSASNLLLSSTSSPAYQQGKLVYDTRTESLTFFNNDSNVSLQVGQEEWIKVFNNTGSTIANGAAVYTTGSTGVTPTVALAQANSAATTVVIGLATEDIPNNATGTVTTIGVVNGLNTSGFTAGSILFLSTTTPGGLVPYSGKSPNYRYRVGIVTAVGTTLGAIHVTPSTAFIGNGESGSVLMINATGNQSFSDTAVFAINTTSNNTGVGTSTPFAKLSVNAPAGIPSFIIGSSTATQFIVDKFGRTGVGTTTPAQTFSVQGNTLISGNITSVSNITATGTLRLSPLATPAGAFLAVNPSGDVISTTSPSGSSGTAVTGMTLVNGVASTSSTGGSFPLATTTTANAGEYIAMTMECTKPGGAGSTDWKLDAWNSVTGTSTIGHSQMQQSGGVNPNMSLGMSGGYQVPSTGTVRFSWTDTSNIISDSTLCQSASQFDFHYERYAPVATPVGGAGSITSGGVGQLAIYSAATTVSGSTDIGVFSNNVGIGTTSPYAKLSVQSGASTGDAFVVATSSGATVGGYDNDGHRFTSGPAPFISSCGTGTGTVVGDDQSGTITTATAATACTMTFSKAYRAAPSCTVADNSLVGFADIASISTSAVTFGISSALTGGNLYYSCSYHK